MTPEELQIVMDKHVKWLNDEPGGERWSCPWNADLGGADLGGANLGGANLGGADLVGANLGGADLVGAKNIPEMAIAQTTLLPAGELIVWKQLAGNRIAKLRIPAEAKRSSATGRKCRAEYADVLEIWDGDRAVDSGFANYDHNFIYRVGETVHPSNGFDEDRWNECAPGIHFWITRLEAENN
jgi:hypothetical protein